jgi:hypothetical protein
MKRFLVAAIALAGCSGNDTTVSMSFARAKLYDAPFPSDDLRAADGTVDVSKVPNPDQVAVMAQGLGLIARDARGFALAGGVFFRTSAAIDPSTLPDVTGSIGAAPSVFLVDVDATQPDFLQRRPLDVAFMADGGPFGDANLIAALPVQGVPLRPGARYAAVVTRDVHDAQGHPLGRSTEMSALASGSQPAGLPDAAFAEYRDALTSLATLVAADRIAALTVFTTDDPAAALPVVRDDALAAHPLVLPATPPTVGETYPDYCVFHATIQVPDYQSGPPPYSYSGGDWRFDANGKPLFDHMETSRVVYTVPRVATPAGGFPTVVFVRTGGGGDDPLVDRGPVLTPTFTTTAPPGSGPAQELARIGYAAVQIDGPLGGMRNATNGDEDFLIFNINNAAALRDNVRESSMELSLLARALPQMGFDASACPGAGTVSFDAAHLAIMGHSMGAWIAPLTLAWEPRFGAAVLSGAGASYIANLMDKTKPLNVRLFAEILLDYNMDDRSLDPHDPALTIMQWAAEPSDPQVYTRQIISEPPTGAVPRHVLMIQGIVDHYILPSIANSTSLSMGLDQGGPVYDADNAEEQMLGQVPLGMRLPLVGRAQLDLPVTGNRAGNVTALVVQHPEDGIEDGHEVMFQTEPPKHQYRCFLSSWLKGVPQVPPDGAADAPCP